MGEILKFGASKSPERSRDTELEAAKRAVVTAFEASLDTEPAETFYAAGGREMPCACRADQIKGEAQHRVDVAKALYEEVKGSDYYHELAAAEILMDTQKVMGAIEGLLSGHSRGFSSAVMGGEGLKELLAELDVSNADYAPEAKAA